MLKSRRRFGAALFLSASLAACPAAAGAQDANTVGPPQLRDFRLPGQRTTPPAQPVAPPAATPAPAPSAAPPAAVRPAPSPVRNRAPAPIAPRTVRLRPTPALATPALQAAPQPAPVATQAPQGAPPAAPPPAPASPPKAAPAPAEPAGGFPWLWLVPAILLVGGVFLFLRRRRAPAEEVSQDPPALAAAAREPEPEPEPEPDAAAAPSPSAGAGGRAWLDVEFRPERAAATDLEAVVHYELTLRNRGEVPAGNIRIEEKMFNASADGEVTAYLQAAVHEVSGSPGVWIEPGAELKLAGGTIAMRKEELQAIEVQGRVIFVPLVAINLAYDWEGGSGRTSRAWIVGRQASTPGGRMGAFRLDLGPRIYRQVDRREAQKLLA